MQALDEKRDAIEEWKNIISKGRELKDIEILDINSVIIDGDTEKAKKIRKKIANRMRKAEQRLWSMKFLTNKVGKGPKQALKQLHIINNEGEKVKTLHNRNLIEEALIKQNLEYYRKVLKTQVFRDKIYQKLKEDRVQDRILNRNL